MSDSSDTEEAWRGARPPAEFGNLAIGPEMQILSVLGALRFECTAIRPCFSAEQFFLEAGLDEARPEMVQYAKSGSGKLSSLPV